MHTLIASIAYSTWNRRPSGLKVLTPLSYSLRVRNICAVPKVLSKLLTNLDSRDQSSVASNTNTDSLQRHSTSDIAKALGTAANDGSAALLPVICMCNVLKPGEVFTHPLGLESAKGTLTSFITWT